MPPKIKAPRKLPTLPHVETFQRLASAIEQIQEKHASRLSFEEHYRCVFLADEYNERLYYSRYAYALVLHKQGAVLYNGVKDLVIKHLIKETQERIAPAVPTLLVTDSSGSAAASQAINGSSSSSSPRRASTSRKKAPVLSTASLPDTMDRQALAQQGEKFLAAVKGVWNDHEACMSKLKDVLKYMVSTG